MCQFLQTVALTSIGFLFQLKSMPFTTVEVEVIWKNHKIGSSDIFYFFS
jgi:hypothetical protein